MWTGFVPSRNRPHIDWLYTVCCQNVQRCQYHCNLAVGLQNMHIWSYVSQRGQIVKRMHRTTIFMHCKRRICRWYRQQRVFWLPGWLFWGQRWGILRIVPSWLLPREAKTRKLQKVRHGRSLVPKQSGCNVVRCNGLLQINGKFRDFIDSTQH